MQGLLDSTSLIMIVCSTPRLCLAGGCCSGGGGEGTDFSVPLNSPTHFPFRVPLRPTRSRVTTERERERDPYSLSLSLSLLSPSLPLSLFLFVRECSPRCGCLRACVPPCLPSFSSSLSLSFSFEQKVRIRLHEHPYVRVRARPCLLCLPEPPRAVFVVLVALRAI